MTLIEATVRSLQAHFQLSPLVSQHLVFLSAFLNPAKQLADLSPLPFWKDRLVFGLHSRFENADLLDDTESHNDSLQPAELCLNRRVGLGRVVRCCGFLRLSRYFSLRFGIFRSATSRFRRGKSPLLRALEIPGVFQRFRSD
jgi:hypothetical protein